MRCATHVRCNFDGMQGRQDLHDCGLTQNRDEKWCEEGEACVAARYEGRTERRLRDDRYVFQAPWCCVSSRLSRKFKIGPEVNQFLFSIFGAFLQLRLLPPLQMRRRLLPDIP